MLAEVVLAAVLAEVVEVVLAGREAVTDLWSVETMVVHLDEPKA